jgi:ribose transport system ATP-binding protein
VNETGGSAEVPSSAGAETAPPVLEVRGLTKHYPGANALDGVDLVVLAGQVHCLVGQNGAGKSTLIKCVSGAVAPTGGIVLLYGRPLPQGDPVAALHAGVATIYQELDLVADLDVAENLFLGHELRTAGFISRRRTKAAARELLARLGHEDIDPDALVGQLRPAQQQVVSLARALSHQARLLIMDEPSAVLDDHEVETMFAVVRRLTAEGVGIVYISHRLDEVAEIGDTITVLKDGRTVASGLAPDTPTAALIEHMVGRDLGEVFPAATTAPTGEVALRVLDLRRLPDVKDISLTVGVGEIVGIGGLVGAGRTELLRLIYGLDRRDAGVVEVAGRLLPPGRPDLSVRAGVGFAPEERKSQGLWAGWSQVRNVTVATLERFRTGPLLSPGAERSAARIQLQALNTVPDEPDRMVSELSGGNQQKVVLARWLLRDGKVLLLDEPTRGVDVGAKAEIYRVIRDLAAAGLGLLLVSSELNELVGLCDRVLVVREGELVAELSHDDLSEEAILQEALAR